MPIHEYQCDACNYKFDYLVLRNNEPNQCPSCNETTVKKLISICGFINKNANNNSHVNTNSSSHSSCGSCVSSNCSGCK